MADTHLSSLVTTGKVDAGTGLNINGTEVLNTNVTSLPKVTKVALAIATAAAGLLEWVNPESGAIIVLGVSIDVTTAATAACAADVGVATSATGISDDTIMDGASLAAIAVVNSIANAGTNGVAPVKVPAGQYITGSASTVATDSIVGSVYIEYVPA